MEVIWRVLTRNRPPAIESEFISILHREETTWFVQTADLLSTGTWGRGGGTWWGFIYLNLDSQFKTEGHENRNLDPGVGGALAPDGGRETICTWDAEYLEIRKDGLWHNLDSTPILTLYWHVDWGSNCLKSSVLKIVHIFEPAPGDSPVESSRNKQFKRSSKKNVIMYKGESSFPIF